MDEVLQWIYTYADVIVDFLNRLVAAIEAFLGKEAPIQK